MAARSHLKSNKPSPDYYEVNDTHPTAALTQPPPPAASEPARPWTPIARNAILAVGFAILVLGALADIAHFVDGRSEGSAPDTTVRSQLDETTPPLAATAEVEVSPAPGPPDGPTPLPAAVFDPIFNTYTVTAGDVLYDIATRHGTTTQVLIELNEITDPNRIEVGQVLVLPSPDAES